MSFLVKQFLDKCATEYAHIGFRKEHHTYARIINDILQTFTVKQMNAGKLYTVEFGIYPLSMGLCFCPPGYYTLESFDIDSYLNGGWICESISKEHIRQCLQAIEFRFELDVIPLFLRATSSEKALNELIELDVRFEANRQHALQKKGLVDRAKSQGERLRWSSEKYYLALNAWDSAYIARYLSFHIEHSQQRLDHFRNHIGDVVQPPFVIEREERALEELLLHKEMFDKGKQDFFCELLNKNETLSKNSLRKFLYKA